MDSRLDAELVIGPATSGRTRWRRSGMTRKKSLRGAARGDDLVRSAAGQFGHVIKFERESAGAGGGRADFHDQVADLGFRHFGADHVPAVPAFACIEAQDLSAPAR